MRIIDGDNVLDTTSIHPESYDITLKLLKDIELSTKDIGSDKLIQELDKINIEKNQAVILHNMRHKYDNNILDILELNQIIIQQIDEEEKAEKEAKKQERLEKRLNKQKI